MTTRQSLFVISITLGLVVTCLCIPSIIHYFEWLYVPGEVHAGSACGGALAMCLTIPMKIVSFLSVVLMWLANIASIALTFVTTQIPTWIFLALTRR
jgi:hypothetical protein